jgi:hypothetical protein
MRKMREWRLSQIALSEALGKLHTDVLLRNFITDIADRVNFQTPYPLDPETAAIVDSAIRHHVHTWEAITDERYIADWLWEYLINQGAKDLPLSSSHYIDGKKQTNITPENEAEIRACFPDDAKFQLFRSGQDYTCDLASITDAEYYQHYETIVSNIKELVKSGQVAAGRVIRLESIPIPFLRDVPLVEGQWLDQQVVELAEWGAILKAKGFQVQEDDGANLLATLQFTQDSDQKVTPEEILAFRGRAQLFFKKYSGRTREIDGRQFISFEDYCAWRGRKVKGDLKQLIKEGVVTVSWNRWIKDHGSEKPAQVGEVPVGELSCHIDKGSYYTCQHDSAGQLLQKEALLDSIRIFSFKPDRKENLVQEWKESVTWCLITLYAFHEAVNSIQKSYFDGQHVTFADIWQELGEIITLAETTVNNFNSSFAEGMELFKPLDLEALRSEAQTQASQVVIYIIDSAKVEALDCLGDTETAMKLAERYL